MAVIPNYLGYNSDNSKWYVVGYRRTDKLFFGLIKNTPTAREYDWQWTLEQGLYYYNQSLTHIPKYVQKMAWTMISKFKGE